MYFYITVNAVLSSTLTLSMRSGYICPGKLIKFKWANYVQYFMNFMNFSRNIMNLCKETYALLLEFIDMLDVYNIS